MAYGHNAHLSIDNFLNKVQYQAEIPEYALPKHKAFVNEELEPFHVPDKNTRVLSAVTIATMIDFSEKIIPFRILKAEDIKEIYIYLNEYIRQLGEFADMPEAQLFLGKCRRFSDKLEISINKISKTDKAARDILYNNKVIDIFKTSLSE